MDLSWYWEEENFNKRLNRICSRCESKYRPKTKSQKICHYCQNESIKKRVEIIKERRLMA